jgi:hypothetical protein
MDVIPDRFLYIFKRENGIMRGPKSGMALRRPEAVYWTRHPNDEALPATCRY